MAPIIKVSNETLKALDVLGVKYSPIEQERIADLSSDAPKGFMYVPELKMYVSKERIGFNENFENQQRIAKEEGGRVITISEFKEVLKYTKINDSELYGEITEIKSPWRAERLDARFVKIGEEFYIHTHKGEEKLPKNILMQDRTPGISIDSWLENNSKQGLPKKNIKKGNLFYWSPRDEAVASFNADSDGTNLNCNWNPYDRDSDLGARVAIKHR